MTMTSVVPTIDGSKPVRIGDTPWGDIAEQLAAIDTSCLAQASLAQREHQRLEAFRQRLHSVAAPFSDSVRRRVSDDYLNRQARLEQEMLPLQSHLRHEYDTLQALHQRLDSAASLLLLDKEEQELRHAVGELNDADLAQQLQRLQPMLDACRSDLAAVAQLRASVLESLGADEVLPFEAFPSVDQNLGRGDQLPVEVPLPPGIVSRGSTAGDARPDRTVVVPPAALVLEAEGSSGTAYPLGMLNEIGRSANSHIHLDKPNVSRHHACIALNQSGFSIEHTGTVNGTFVNGRSITRALLADGDRIDIGEIRLRFRSPWPRAGREK